MTTWPAVSEMSEGSTSVCAVFQPSGKRGEFPVGTSVLNAARQLRVDVDSVCGGRAICGRCQIMLSEGETAGLGVSAPTAVEEAFSQRRPLAAGRRLSCQARLEGNVVISVPAESQVHKPLVRKSWEALDVQLEPAVRLYLVEVPRPSFDNPASDLERLLSAIQKEWQLDRIQTDISVLQSLQNHLRNGGWRVTVAIRDGTELVGVWPGFKDTVYGIALDVGTTTIAAHLSELGSGEARASAGATNPQIRFGEDLMNRVSFALQNGGGAKLMTDAVREAINRLIAEVAAQGQIQVSDILEVTLVGNPIMHHLVIGLDPGPLGVAPFTLATDRAMNIRASEIGLEIHPAGRVYVLPCIAGHVGADTAAVILAECPEGDEKTSLVIDIGTNAEIVLACGSRLLAASTPTGPAFEGAHISCGQRAAQGAVERVRIDPETLEPRFKVIGCDLWSNEPGFENAVRTTGVTGICGSGIIEAMVEMFLNGIISAEGVIDGCSASRTRRVVANGRTYMYVLHDGEPRLSIEQKDVRAIQLAKAALYAGTQLLLEHAGVQTLNRIRLAGTFGSHIDVKYAMLLGMIPDCDEDQVSSAGNAAGTGARIALLNRSARKKIECRVRLVEKIETATEPNFQQHFIDALAIPHRKHPFSRSLGAAIISLPQWEPNTPSRRQRRQSKSGEPLNTAC